MKKHLLIDDIIPGKNLETIRKIYDFSISQCYLSIKCFNSY